MRKNLTKTISFFILTLTIASFISCKDKEETLSTEKSILTFEAENYPVSIDESSKTITITTPASAKTTISPTITVSPKAQIYPRSGETIDLSHTVNYTVRAEDGSSVQYILQVAKIPGVQTVSFYSGGITYNGIIDDTNQTIVFSIPYTEVDRGVGRVTMKLNATFSGNYTMTPASDSNINFRTLREVTITNNDDNTNKTYSIIFKNNETEINFSCNIGGLTLRGAPAYQYSESAINKSGLNPSDIIVRVLTTDDVTNITPTITLPNGATISPAIGVAQNFSQDVRYTITAEAGNTQTYTVRLAKRLYDISNEDGPIKSTQQDRTSFNTYFRSISPIKKAWMVDENNENNQYLVNIINNGNNSISINNIGTMPLDIRCYLKVELLTGEIILTKAGFKRIS